MLVKEERAYAMNHLNYNLQFHAITAIDSNTTQINSNLF